MYSWVYENLSKCAYLHVHVQLILIQKDIKKITHVFFYLKKEIPQRMQNRYIDIVQDILI